MSRLKDLMAELCPDGVEYKTVESVVTIHRGTRVVRRDLKEEGSYPVYQNSLKPLGFYHQKNVHGDAVFVICAGAAGDIGYSSVDFWAADDCFFFEESNEILPRYLYHLLLAKEVEIKGRVRKASIPRLSHVVLEKLVIPVPPLPVQREIVRILDNFTELTAELTARKKQYEYYRDRLLTFTGGHVEWKTLGEISLICRGASPRPIKNFLTTKPNGVHWIKIGDVEEGAKYITSCKEKITQDGAQKSRYVHQGDFIFSNSMSFGRPFILKIDGCIHDGWLSITAFQKHVTPDYLYHILMSSSMQYTMRKKASYGGAVQNLNADIVRELEIPVPPLSEQRRIVSILDHFDALTHDLASGLPAEIAARKKQYAYYLDKLLSFPRKEI